MGRSIYLTDKEIAALRTTAGEWCEMMGTGEETITCVEERLAAGLGSAMLKLYEGTNGKKYIEVISKRY